MASYFTGAGRAFAFAFLASLQAQTPEESARAVRFDPTVVQVDAVVSDARGAYVRDLKADDFRILQDGKARKITSVSYVADAPQAHHPRTIVFLINDGNMVAANMVRVRDALHRFADEQLQADDRVALVTTMGGSGYLRQFLAAGGQLHTAIDDLRWRPAAPDALVQSRAIELMRRTILALAQMPGRKSIIVLSNDMLGERFDLRAIADAASRASVVFHAVNPRPGQFDDSGEGFLPSLAAATCGLARTGGLDLEANLRDVMQDQAGYYLIGFDPGPALKQLWSWPVYHRLAVKSNRPGLTVRSRDGFFGVSGPIAPAGSASKSQQIMAALYTPLRPQQISVRVTPVVRQRENERYVQSIIYMGKGIEFTSDKDDCYRASVTIYSSFVRLNSQDDATLSIHGASLRMCGQVAQSVRENGLVAMVEQRLSEAGDYQLYVGVRNGTSGAEDAQAARPNGLIRRADWKHEVEQIGTASEFFEFTNSNSPALLLRGPGTPPASAGKPSQIVFRTMAQGDSALRDFHGGDVLTYDVAPQSNFQVMRDGEVVDSGDATGVYRVKESLMPGQYLFQSMSQWQDFRIVK